MTHFAYNPGSVRVDEFKPSGKWYQTIVIDMTDQYLNPSIHDAVMDCLVDRQIKLEPGWRYVCIKPYHQYAHPVMLEIKE